MRSRKRAEANEEFAGAAKPNKYKAEPVYLDGLRFASEIEAHRYLYLKDRERRGEIRNLACQTRLYCAINGKKVWYLQPDYRFYDNVLVRTVFEDTKGMCIGPAWQMFSLKKKTVEALYGITIDVVTKGAWQKPYKEIVKLARTTGP